AAGASSITSSVTSATGSCSTTSAAGSSTTVSVVSPFGFNLSKNPNAIFIFLFLSGYKCLYYSWYIGAVLPHSLLCGHLLFYHSHLLFLYFILRLGGLINGSVFQYHLYHR